MKKSVPLPVLMMIGVLLGGAIIATSRLLAVWGLL